MSSAGRHAAIARAVGDAGTVTVQRLAELTGASEMTVRRDLDMLAAQGVLERVRGGARTLLLRGDEPPFVLRALEAVDAKRRIATAVAGMIADGESVLLDSGTTCLEVARLLHGRSTTVVPLSLQAIEVLGRAPALCTLVVPGGQPRPGEGALAGPLTITSLAALRFDTAVIGCCGLEGADGLTAYDLDDAAVKKACVSSSRRVIVAADARKIGRTAYAHVVPVSGLHAVVTEPAAPADQVSALEDAGVVVSVV
ncbi:DeoR/GlpR family DNA-binding transcription regulator [Pseudonocardia phyllosphaerae]|uniref:DeoR/GlpR family DNA-binding transcription regulator n=1 Tax=Pseudonocardia phyllosphaerae TaxID=3390502 RepID=UPI00397CE3D4